MGEEKTGQEKRGEEKEGKKKRKNPTLAEEQQASRLGASKPMARNCQEFQRLV